MEKEKEQQEITEEAKNSGIISTAIDDDDFLNWYIIHTYSGYEEKSVEAIKSNMLVQGLMDHVRKVIVPLEPVEEIKKGKKQLTYKRIYPGYILIKMEVTDDIIKNKIWNVIKRIQGVSGFVGPQGHPVKISPSEVKEIFKHIQGRASKPRPVLEYEVDETVRIIQGPFSEMFGKIESIDEEKGKLKAMVDIFGRATPVEVDFNDVEKL